MKELGEYLKHTRISSGLSITEVCEDLDFSTSLLENMESGNVKAFKDVYSLRDLIKKYANYLGLDADKVLDEFNDFLFEDYWLEIQKNTFAHTSRISLEDIQEARKIVEENTKKVKSPYTIEHKEKFNFWPIIYVFIGFLLIVLVVYIALSIVNKTPEKSNELMPVVEREMF